MPSATGAFSTLSFGTSPHDNLAVQAPVLSELVRDIRDDDMEEEDEEDEEEDEEDGDDWSGSRAAESTRGVPVLVTLTAVPAAAVAAEVDEAAFRRIGDAALAFALSAPCMTGSDVSSRKKSSWSPPIP